MGDAMARAKRSHGVSHTKLTRKIRWAPAGARRGCAGVPQRATGGQGRDSDCALGGPGPAAVGVAELGGDTGPPEATGAGGPRAAERSTSGLKGIVMAQFRGPSSSGSHPSRCQAPWRLHS